MYCGDVVAIWIVLDLGMDILIGIGMNGTVIESRDREVLLEIDAFVAGVGVGAVAAGWGQPAFVTEGDEVPGVERLY